MSKKERPVDKTHASILSVEDAAPELAKADLKVPDPDMAMAKIEYLFYTTKTFIEDKNSTLRHQ